MRLLEVLCMCCGILQSQSNNTNTMLLKILTFKQCNVARALHPWLTTAKNTCMKGKLKIIAYKIKAYEESCLVFTKCMVEMEWMPVTSFMQP